MMALYKRELRSLLSGLVGWGFIALYLLLSGAVYLFVNIVPNDPFMAEGTTYHALAMALACGVCGMTAYAADRRDNTLKMIYAMPVSSVGIALGKLLARWTLVVIASLFAALYPLLLHLIAPLSRLYEGLGCVAIICAMGLMFMAAAVFCAALTRNALTALAAYAVMVAAAFFLPYLAPYVDAVNKLTLPMVVLIPLICGMVVYMLFNDVLAGFIGAAAALVPIMICYLRSNGSVVFDRIAGAMNAVGVFNALKPFTQGLFDLSVVIRFVLLALVLAIAAVMATASARQAQRRMP